MLFKIVTLLSALLFADCSSAYFVVTGARGGCNTQTRQRPSRNEISTLAASGPAWDLFVLSIKAIQEKSQDDPLGWFGFAGIHGRPFQVWDGVKGIQRDAGYAPHNSILFGPWHRVYLAAYEQLISTTANDIAAKYPQDQKERYASAAMSLRIPYWDWAINPELPKVATDEKLTLNTPTGTQEIDNPLAQYVFHPHPSESQFPAGDGVSLFNTTVRTPDTNGKPQISAINDLLRSNAEQTLDKLYLLIARQTDYAAFSNTGVPAERRNGSYDSLESIHNMIHAFVGGMGHMGFVPYSSFDPLFFMHHANIDRFLTIWAAINPRSYVVPQVNSYGTFTYNPGTTETSRTALKPFHSDRWGNFHTANTVRDTNRFGYTYPEVQDSGVDAATLAANTRKAFNDLYNPLGLLSKRRLRSASRILPRDTLNQTVAINTTEISGVPREWYINLSVKRDSRRAFFVNFFLGSPPEDPTTWRTADNLIVAQPVLSELMSGTVDLPSLSQIPLTRSLTKMAQDPTNVNATVDFIKNNLQWRYLAVDGKVLDSANVRNMTVSVLDQEVEMTPSQTDFHNYMPLHSWPGLTWNNEEQVS